MSVLLITSNNTSCFLGSKPVPCRGACTMRSRPGSQVVSFTVEAREWRVKVPVGCPSAAVAAGSTPLGSDGSDEDTAAGTTPLGSTCSSVAGDSEYGARDQEEGRHEQFEPADAQPQQSTVHAPPWTPEGQRQESREDLGNLGYIFLNNGARAKNVELRDHMDMTLKKNPAQVVGMAECQAATEEVLRSGGEDGDKTAPPRKHGAPR